MTKTNQQLYQVRLISGRTIDNLTHEQATDYFYRYAGSMVRPWPVKPYKAP